MKGSRKRRSSTSGSRKRKRSLRRRVPRSLGTLGRQSNAHHFKETINGGVLFINPSTGSASATAAGAFLGTGVYVMQLSDFPIFQRMNGIFEFCRLNKCTIEFIPKYNMQSNANLFTAGTAAQFSSSTTGTFVTALDQIPVVGITLGTSATAPNWVNDSSNSSGTTVATPLQCNSVTVGYVRGIEGSKEKELYKKHRIAFNPAFYSQVLSNGTSAAQASTVCYQRQIKKWVTTGALEPGGSESRVVNNTGPYYYGPIYALDINAYAGSTSDNINIPLYDIRLTYSMSFKRLRGV